jgi:hypothetical protein
MPNSVAVRPRRFHGCVRSDRHRYHLGLVLYRLQLSRVSRGPDHRVRSRASIAMARGSLASPEVGYRGELSSGRRVKRAVVKASEIWRASTGVASPFSATVRPEVGMRVSRPSVDLRYSPLPSVLLQPLGHLSVSCRSTTLLVDGGMSTDAVRALLRDERLARRCSLRYQVTFTNETLLRGKSNISVRRPSWPITA